MLDILFIHPNASKKIYQDLSDDFSAIEPPIWAGLLANHCRKEGFSVGILDCEAEQLSDSQAVAWISAQKPKIACFVVYGQQPSASTQNMEGATSLSALLRTSSPEIKILFVGGHIAALPEITMQLHPEIDFVCQNEGVYTISDLLRTTEDSLRYVHGLGYRKDSEALFNGPSRLVHKDKLAEDLPGIAWDLMPMDKYRTSLWHAYTNDCDRSNFAAIYTSLGCSFGCSFCMINIINRTTGTYANESRIFRPWHLPSVFQQFETMAGMGIKNVKIADELFCCNAQRVEEICNFLIEREYNFNIWCYARVDTIKKEQLNIMKRAGINWVGLGIESAVKKVRNDANKGKFDEVDIRKVVKDITDSGINVAANYIFGLPEDNMKSMEDTLAMAIEINTPMSNFYCATAYPGSPLYGKALENGWKLPNCYVGYSQHSYETQPLPSKYLTAKEILKFRDNAWMKYHTNDNFLSLIETKFGSIALKEVQKSTKIKLKRKLLND